MDRAIASGAIGREFESLRAHQISPCDSTTSGASDRDVQPIFQDCAQNCVHPAAKMPQEPCLPRGERIDWKSQWNCALQSRRASRHRTLTVPAASGRYAEMNTTRMALSARHGFSCFRVCCSERSRALLLEAGVVYMTATGSGGESQGYRCSSSGVITRSRCVPPGGEPVSGADSSSPRLDREVQETTEHTDRTVDRADRQPAFIFFLSSTTVLPASLFMHRDACDFFIGDLV